MSYHTEQDDVDLAGLDLVDIVKQDLDVYLAELDLVLNLVKQDLDLVLALDLAELDLTRLNLADERCSRGYSLLRL